MPGLLAASARLTACIGNMPRLVPCLLLQSRLDSCSIMLSKKGAQAKCHACTYARACAGAALLQLLLALSPVLWPKPGTLGKGCSVLQAPPTTFFSSNTSTCKQRRTLCACVFPVSAGQEALLNRCLQHAGHNFPQLHKPGRWSTATAACSIDTDEQAERAKIQLGTTPCALLVLLSVESPTVERAYLESLSRQQQGCDKPIVTSSYYTNICFSCTTAERSSTVWQERISSSPQHVPAARSAVHQFADVFVTLE